MKLDKICRTCLLEKANLKPLFEACLPNMLISCATIQVMLGDGLPNKICSQCIQSLSRAYSFKQLCEKSDATLREYIQLQNIPLQTTENLLNSVKTDQLFGSTDLQQSSIFQDIFNDATTQSLVEDFTVQAGDQVPDLAETVKSLQIIAEQCLPDSWDNDHIVSCTNTVSAVDNTYNFDIYKCEFCGDLFKDEWSLGEHIKNHTGQNNKYYCNYGNKMCNNSVELNKHILDHAADKNMVEQTIKLCEKEFMCNTCDRTFTDNKYLKKHLKEIHFVETDACIEAEKKYICNICNKSYRQNKNLVFHMRSHTGERPFKCEICTATFSLASSLHKHKNIHGEKKYTCTICGKKFNQTSNLNNHLKKHTGLKPHLCNICNKSFTTNASLDIHIRTHTGEKPYACSFCQTGFASATQLKKHTRKHTGEKPYCCWQCGKSFTRKETRDTHVRYHTGERPYSCPLCTKKYIAANHLRVHMKSHNNDRKYECMVCSKKFLEMKTLKKHILSNTCQKPFCCNNCGQQCANLNNHLKTCRAIL